MYRLAVARPVSTLIGCATLVGLGVLSLARLPVSLLPDIERPRLVVHALAPGRSGDELVAGLTEPMEQQLSSLPQVRSVRSETGDGFVHIAVETDFETPADLLQIEAVRRLEGIGSIRPTSQQVTVTGGDATPIVDVAVLGGSTAARTNFARRVLLPELARIDGAGHIEILGAWPRRVIVKPRAAALAARRLTVGDVVERLGAVGHAEDAGLARDGAAVRPLVVRESVTSVDQLRALWVTADGVSVALGDVADIAIDELSDGTSYRDDSGDGVLVRISRSPGANAVALAQRVREQTRAVATRLPGGIRLQVVADNSQEVRAALTALAVAAVSGVGLGALVLWLFLGRLGSTVALAVVVPASLLASFAGFDLFAVPLNLISLAGLVLASGMLVDGAIVVLEAIDTTSRDRDNDGRDGPDLAIEGTRQVAGAVVASALTTIVAFVPLLYLSGLARAFFAEQAFAITTSLSASVLFSLTLTPVLATRRRRRAEVRDNTGRSPGRASYLATLAWLLERPRLTLLTALVVLAGAFAAVGKLPRELLPQGASSALVVTYQLPDEWTQQVCERRADAFAARIRAAVSDRVVSVRSLRGLEASEDLAGAQNRWSSGELHIQLLSPDRATSVQKTIADIVATTPDIRATIERERSALITAFGRASNATEIVVTAIDEPRLEHLIEQTSTVIEAAVGQRPTRTVRRPQPVWLIDWQQTVVARTGNRVEALEQQVARALVAVDAGRVDIDGVEPEVRVEPVRVETLAALPVRLDSESTPEPATVTVPLAALARITSSVRPARTLREDRRPAERLRIDRNRVDTLAITQALSKMPVAPGESARLVGAGLETERAFAQLTRAIALSTVLVFLTLSGVYESLVLPALIMLPVPVAATGALLALLLTGQSLNVMSLLGMLLLCGIVVNNAIVLVSRIEERRRAGVSELVAVRLAADERYRPILMTSATTLLGMLPLAVLTGSGQELRQALAITVIGGLATSVPAALLLVPVAHQLLARTRDKVHTS